MEVSEKGVEQQEQAPKTQEQRWRDNYLEQQAPAGAMMETCSSPV
jgi:hypothetical protein